MNSKRLIPTLVLALCPTVFAQQFPAAGSQMQQIPPIPIPQRALPQLDIQPRPLSPMTEPEVASIVVSSLWVRGAQTYTEPELLALTGFVPGSKLSLFDLRVMAAKISDFYHRNGYFVAQAYLPSQDIQHGIVTIAVVEGQYGKITLNNRAEINDELANDLMNGLNSGDPVTSAALENRLLMLSDLPGVRVTSALTPGAARGTSDLVVDITPGQRLSGSVDADNAGNRYTGANRIGATVNFNEPTGHGDVATLRAISSGAGLNYLRASYQLQLGKTKVGLAYSNLRYVLGQEFESLGAHGTEEIASLYAGYPLIRSRNNNLYASISLDGKTFQDRVDATASVTDKRAKVLTASLSGDQRDSFAGGGLSSYSLAWSTGTVDLQTPAMQTLDALTAQSGGHFNKLGFSATRLQSLTDTVALWASFSGQLASKNLDTSEKMGLGGMYGVRAYPQGEAYADQGYLLTLEGRMQLPGQVQLVAFVDTGSVDVNKAPWSVGPNRRTLSGAGVGLSWADTNNFMLRAYYAFKLGDEAATSAPDASGRFWIQAVKYF